MIIQLRNPKVPELYPEFFQRAFAPSPWGQVIAQNSGILGNLVKTASLVWLLAFEDGQPVGLSIIALPESPLERNPQVLHLYSEGTKGVVRRELIKATVEAIKERGYNSFMAVNFTFKSDRKWKQVMQPEGWTIKKIGSLMRFTANG